MIRFATRTILAAGLVAAASSAQARDLVDSNGNLAALISRHAAANNVPESLVRRVILRESRGNARAVSKGNYGLMQIKLATARGMGYSGDARGLLDADTNMTYAVKYLAGAYRAAGGSESRAVSYYASGYYYAAKRQGLDTQTVSARSKGLASYASADSSSGVASSISVENSHP